MTYNAPPSVPDTKSGSFQGFLLRELQKIARDSQFVEAKGLKFTVCHVVPDKPRQGLVVYADGTDWNPGSGEGVYRYDGAAWQYLG